MSIATEPPQPTAAAPTTAPFTAPPGLAGVVVAETSIGDVLGGEGRYHYRGHDAIDLARAGDFEAAWHLLVLGTLPDTDAAARFRARTAALRQLPSSVREFIAEAATAVADAAAAASPVPRSHVATGGSSAFGATVRDDRTWQVAESGSLEGSVVLDPLRGLQATLPVLAAARGAGPLYDSSEDERIAQALAVAAAAPGILAAFFRASRGLVPFIDVTTPGNGNGDEDGAATPRGAVTEYLRLVTDREPGEQAVRALSAYLIATLDHGFNASTFTARVIASTGADLASCIVGGLGALSGPLHGGAPSRVLDALDAVGTRARVEPFIRGELSAGRRLMGFGHAVYSTADPRSRLLRRVALEFGGPRVDLALEYEQTAERLLAEYKPGRELHTNVEFYAAVVLEQCGIPRELFTPTFAMARVVGWTAHVLEQARDPKIIRPSSRYAPEPPLVEPPLV